MVTLCYVEKILSFFKAMHHVHVHCVHCGDQALHQRLLVVVMHHWAQRNNPEESP